MMRKSIIVIAVAIMALLAVTAVMAADPLCAGESSCNSKDTVLGTPKYCTGTGNDAKCEDKKAKEKGNTIAADEYCKDTFKSGSNKCMTLGTKGCKAEDAYCVFQNYDDEGNCVPESNEEDKSSVEEGGRCDEGDPTKHCKLSLNLFCHPIHKICTKAGKAGEPCDKQCEAGTMCNYGICVPFGSLPDFAYATDSMLCKSGKTNNVDQCVPTYAQEDYGQQCISNADCKSNLHEVCDTKAKRCVSSHQHAELDYWTCVGQRCRGYENALNCPMSKCQAAAVKTHCAESCSNHAEKRLPFVIYDAAYSVDCKSLKMTKLEDNKCGINPADVVTNCDAAFSSYRKSSANSIAGSPAAVLMTVTASVLSALLFL